MSNPIRIRPFAALKSAGHSGDPLQDYRKPIINALRNFARWAGLRSLPPETVKKLNETGNYFIFCFSVLISDPISLIVEGSASGHAIKQRYLELLADPAKVTATDLFKGLYAFLGNFSGYLPGGHYRLYYQHCPDIYADKKTNLDLVDLILSENGTRKKAEQLHDAMAEEEKGIIAMAKVAAKSGRQPVEIFDKRIEYFKFCLYIFETLVGRYKVDPKTLWH